MVVIKKTKTKKSGQVTSHRRHYSLEMKHKVFFWKHHDKLSLKQIKVKVKQTFGETVPHGTLCGFYKPSFNEYFNKTAADRLKVKDTRINPKQRPDIVLDMEKLLARRCMEMYARTGSPYVSRMVRLLGLHIYDQLLQTGIYDTKGQRKNQDKPLDEEDDLTDEAREALVFTFKASPGWLKNFMKRNF